MSRTCMSTCHAHIQKPNLVHRIGPFLTTRFVLRLLDFWSMCYGYASPVQEEWGDSRDRLNESSHTFERVIVTHSLSNVWLDSFKRLRESSHSSYRNESHCHMFAWVTSQVWTSHITRLNDWRHVTGINESPGTFARDTSHVWKSSHTYEWVPWHVWTSHVTRVNESCRTRVNESRHTCVWVMSQIWTGHVTHVNPSCLSRPFQRHRIRRVMWMSHVRNVKKALSTGSPRTNSFVNESYHTHIYPSHSNNTQFEESYGWVTLH